MFSQKVLEIAFAIPPGRVMTYGQIAQAAGGGSAMSITSILWKAEQMGAKNIPYHRIVYANGKVWIDDQHREERLKLYKKEGIKLDKHNRIINFRDVRI